MARPDTDVPFLVGAPCALTAGIDPLGEYRLSALGLRKRAHAGRWIILT